MSRLVLQVKKLTEHAVLPARATPGAAGYDLCRYVDTAGQQEAQGEAGSCSERAITDVQSRARSAYSAYDGVVPARGKALLKTDVAIAVPAGTYGRVGE
jgi:dUTPase